MSGVQRIRLCELNMNIRNALVVGVIIAKSSVRKFAGRGKNETRGVTSFSVRDSENDTINCNVWGSEYFAQTFTERFLVGDTVEISSPKIEIKQEDRNEMFRPHVTSPFFLTLNEGVSDVCIYSGDEVGSLLRLLHTPSKPSAGYHGLADVLKMTEVSDNMYVDLLVVLKSVAAVKNIKTKTGVDMRVRSVEIMDSTTPATIKLDIFDDDTIQRASEWSPMESVLFVADGRVSWRWRSCSVTVTSRTVITHQPHTSDAEALRLNIHNMKQTRGPSGAAAWAAWGIESGGAATVSQIRDRLAGPTPTPFTLTLHALLTHMELDALGQMSMQEGQDTELRIRLADHTGELSARMEAAVLEESLGHTIDQLRSMPRSDLEALRWRVLLERCCARVAAYPPRVVVLALRLATAQDPMPLY